MYRIPCQEELGGFGAEGEFTNRTLLLPKSRLIDQQWNRVHLVVVLLQLHQME